MIINALKKQILGSLSDVLLDEEARADISAKIDDPSTISNLEQYVMQTYPEYGEALYEVHLFFKDAKSSELNEIEILKLFKDEYPNLYKPFEEEFINNSRDINDVGIPRG